MQFQVPKFLERETTIAFGLTFKKLIIAGGLGLFLFILKFMLPRSLWIVAIILFAGVFFSLAFIKIGGHSLYSLLLHSFSFFSSARVYVWEQKQGASPIKIVNKKESSEKSGEPLKVLPKTVLGGLKSKIDLGESGLQENEIKE